MENIIYKNFRGYLENLYQHTAVDASMSYRDLSIALDFFTYGIGGVLIESSRNGRTDPEVLTDQLYRLLSGQRCRCPWNSLYSGMLSRTHRAPYPTWLLGYRERPGSFRAPFRR